MSMATWKAEFYPIPAKDAAGDPLTAAEHSLVKWRGLRKEALSRHGVAIDATDGGRIYSSKEAFLDIDADSCALCNNATDAFGTECERCPLFAALGHRCIESEDSLLSPYDEFTDNQNPEPMIAALEATVKMLEARA